jgi:hypothetical protein
MFSYEMRAFEKFELCALLGLTENKGRLERPMAFFGQSILSILGAAVFYFGGTIFAVSQDPDVSQEFAKCKVIVNDQVRLNCLKNLLPGDSMNPSGSTARDLWPLVRTPHPQGGPEAVAIMRTADTARSDADLAGLMIRCKEKPGFEVLLALVRPVPPRTKRDVVVTLVSTQSVLRAEASVTGTALILPIEATAFTTGPWRELKELTVSIKDPETEIGGVIPLGGLAAAMAKLSASCPSG